MNGTVKEKLYIIRERESGKLVFTYRTAQGNRKKALFRNIKEAQEAIRYIEPYYNPLIGKWQGLEYKYKIEEIT